jgi:predicted DNA-binding transcriptional regulator AlpA
VLTVREAAALLKCSISSLNKWRVYGVGPRFVKIGGCVRYRSSELQAYLETRTRTSTAAA